MNGALSHAHAMVYVVHGILYVYRIGLYAMKYALALIGIVVVALVGWYGRGFLFSAVGTMDSNAQQQGSTSSSTVVQIPDNSPAAPGFVEATTSAETLRASEPAAQPPRTKLYKSDRYQFSLYYPDDLIVTETDEGGGARTISFENEKTMHAFQVYVMPYAGKQVSTQRFKQDIPSGVMKNPIALTIDGATATMFESYDEFIGELREVWFIRNGYLYEVTTPKVLDQWLGEIMLTWRFVR